LGNWRVVFVGRATPAPAAAAAVLAPPFDVFLDRTAASAAAARAAACTVIGGGGRPVHSAPPQKQADAAGRRAVDATAAGERGLKWSVRALARLAAPCLRV